MTKVTSTFEQKSKNFLNKLTLNENRDFKVTTEFSRARAQEILDTYPANAFEYVELHRTVKYNYKNKETSEVSSILLKREVLQPDNDSIMYILSSPELTIRILVENGIFIESKSSVTSSLLHFLIPRKSIKYIKNITYSMYLEDNRDMFGNQILMTHTKTRNSSVDVVKNLVSKVLRISK